MELQFAEQINLEEFKSKNYDILIAASGYESRSIAFSSKIIDNIANKVVIGFQEHSAEKQRVNNDEFFKSNGFTEYNCSR